MDDQMVWESGAAEGVARVFGKAQGWKIIPPALYPTEHNFVNLRGKRAGTLKVLGYLGKIRANRPGRWLVQCDCGRYGVRAGYIFGREDTDKQHCNNCHDDDYVPEAHP